MRQHADQLVGRVAELEALDRALAELERRRSRAVELLGEPGIGKTRMLGELAARADARGQIVLSGSASELERELPFWLFVDALDDYVQALEPRRLDLLDDEARQELAHVLPALAGRAADGAPPPERYRTHRAMRALLEALAATKPLVLLLDDLHWADSGSVELLASLLRRPPAAGVLIALAMRPRQVPELLPGALERAALAGFLTRVELGALSASESGELLGGEVSAADARALFEESGGNPLYLQQLARSPRRQAGAGRGDAGVALAGVQVPRAVAAALTEELALLDAGARRLLEGAAVAGDPFEAELAAAAAEVDDAALDVLDELLRRDLIRPTDVPRRFRFRHPLVRGAVYEAAPGGWRLGAHERCAQALAARGAPAAERAHHVERSARHGDLDAVAVLREAAEDVAWRAPATAARLFGAALRLLAPGAPERVGLLAAQARAYFAAGRFADAHAASLESLELVARDDIAARVRLTATCASMENLLGRHQQAHDRLAGAFEQLPDTRSAEAVALMTELGVDGLYRMDYAAMADWTGRALAAARPLGQRALIVEAGGMLTLAGSFRGAVADAESARAETAALVDGMRDEELAPCIRAISSLAAAELFLDRLDGAAEHAERMLAIARATGQGSVLPILFWTGLVRLACGRLAGAAEPLDTGVEIARLSGHAEGAAWNLMGRSQVATAAGDVETALALAEEATEALRGLDVGFPGVATGVALAAALLPAGDPVRAVQVLSSAAGGDELPLLPAPMRTAGFELLARCRLALGQHEEAGRAAALAEACAGSLGLPMAGSMADRAAAAVALAAGDAGAAAERALASAEAAGAVGAPIESALARTLAGRALAAAGDQERATAELHRAAAELDAHGALGHRDAAERELRRLGHRNVHRRTRPGRADGDGVESLTERELQVARLIVDRRTNSQIAGELFLSQKTVETHVRNLFRKLGVSSRVDVARSVERADRAAREPARREPV